MDDLVDIILENDKYKEKLLLTNIKNVKNSQYYSRVIEEVKERCSMREEEYKFDVNQTRQKFKRCITICRNAAMKIKTASGIKRFQEDKEFGSWFGKLLPIICSMDNCQPEQAIEPGSTRNPSPSISNATGGVNDNDDNDNGENDTCATPLSECSPESEETTVSGSEITRKRKSYVPTPSTKKKPLHTEAVLGEIKEAVGSLKTLACDTSSKDILDFLKEESRRQSERDAAFLQLLSSLVPQNNAPPQHHQFHQNIVSPYHHQSSNNIAPIHPPHHSQSSNNIATPHHHQVSPSPSMTFSQPSNQEYRIPQSQFRYGMTSATMSRPPNPEEEQQQGTFTRQMLDPDYP